MEKKPFAENFSAYERRRYRRFATGSALTGCISEWFLDSNTVIILYLVMLGGSESFSMFSSAISALVTVLMSIPFAGVANKLGLRVSYSSAVYLGMSSYVLMAMAPFFGEIAKYVVIVGCFLYCCSRPLYAATWYPICDAFLLKSERGSFFGSMRFTYMTLNAVLIFCAGKLMGAKPPIWIMQIVIFFPGLMLLGRKICMDRLPINPASEKNAYDLKKALAISVRNSELMGFSFYVCMLNMAIAAALPLSILYMKTILNFNAFQIMTITSIGLAGYISGYACVGYLMRLMGTKKFQLMTHGIFLAFLAFLCFIKPDSSYLPGKFGFLFYVNGIAAAFLMCLTSTEMLALAKPTNKLMASAVISTFQSIGTTIGRTGSSIILGLSMLTETWTIGGSTYTKYNSFFFLSLFLVLFSLLFLFLAPSIVPKHKDYYEPSN